MLQLILGLILFFTAHSISMVNEPWRNRMVDRFGEKLWQGVYALISLAGMVMISRGYAEARQLPTLLYSTPTWGRHSALLLMLPLFPLLVATYFPGRIQKTVKHPMLLAVLFWAVAHLLANGTLADLLLFGSFLVWAVADLLSMNRRVQRPIQGAPPSAWNDLIALLVGLALYVAFILWLHTWLFGVAPMV